MTTINATYSPDDNKIRLYASSRLDSETFERVKAAGFRWAPKQDLFFATWNPDAEDLALELAGEIDDEDMSLVERAENRAERFEDYSDKRMNDAETARKAVAAIADNIPFGQPILVGHHSEKHARRDAERIENGMRKAVRMWETSGYWKSRAAGAISAAKYKERPDVRARRIKTIEADKRKRERNKADAEKFLKLWSLPGLTVEQASAIANYDGYSSFKFPIAEYPRVDGASTYKGDMSLWSALDGKVITAEQAAALAIPSKNRIIAWSDRWIVHYEHRLEYERAMLGEAGGTVANRTGPEKGGGCRCWASPRGGWSYIQKVNKVSVTVLDNWGNGGGNFTRRIPFDKLAAVMTAAEVQDARDTGQLIEDRAGDPTGFFLRNAPPPTIEDDAPAAAEPSPVVESDDIAPKAHPCAESHQEAPGAPPLPAESMAPPPVMVAESYSPPADPANDSFQVMPDVLRAGGVKVTVAAQLFPTPRDLAARVVEEARLRPGDRILEPSAGTGRLIDAALASPWEGGELVAVEKNPALASALLAKYEGTVKVRHADFLECNGELGDFSVVVMNPPFGDQADVRHVMHATKFLRPGGRLVAIMSAGVTFRSDRMSTEFRAFVESRGGTIEELPADSFKESGTKVNAVLVSFDTG